MRVIARNMARLLALGLALALPASAARAAEPKAPERPPQPEEVLRSMSSYLAKQKSFQYHAEILFDRVLPNGPKIQLAGAIDVAVVRPGNLYVDYRDDVSDRVVWFGKGLVTVYNPMEGTYAQVPVPKNIDGMVAKMEKEYGTTFPLGELAESKPDQVLSKGVEFAYYVGVHNVDGIFCHHVVLQRKDIDIQVFVETGERPLVRKVVFDYPDLPGDPQYTAVLTDWTFEPPKPELFEPKVPKNAAKVEFLPIRQEVH